jgi:hypothetical protein
LDPQDDDMNWLNPELYKKYIAPNMDKALRVDLPDLIHQVEAPSAWLQSYLLSSTFQGEFIGETKLYTESYLARVQIAFNAYGIARDTTQAYVDNWQLGRASIGRYVAAVGAWEAVFISVQIAFDILGKFWELTLSKGDREDRIRLAANCVKHGAGDIEKGRVTSVGMPLWFTPEGFGTVKAEVTFDEIVAELKLLGRMADCLSVPSEAKERLLKLGTEYGDDPHFIGRR